MVAAGLRIRPPILVFGVGSFNAYNRILPAKNIKVDRGINREKCLEVMENEQLKIWSQQWYLYVVPIHPLSPPLSNRQKILQQLFPFACQD
jgi:hypothetical protein